MTSRPARPGGVLVLAHDACGVGGIQRATRSLTEAIMALDGADAVRVVSLQDPPGAPPPWLVASVRSGEGRVSRLDQGRYLVAALRAGRRQRPAVVIATHVQLAPIAWLLARRHRAPFAVWMHGDEVWADLPRPVVAALRRAEGLWFGSEFTRDQVRARHGLDGQGISMLRYCVDRAFLETEPTRPREPVAVVTIARLSSQHRYKGIDRLIRIWPRVLDVVPGATLTVVGDGDDRPRLTALAEELGVAGAVRFCGRLSDEEVIDCLDAAAVFALPTTASVGTGRGGEGFGIVFIEAGARGVAVLGGRSAGEREAVDDGVTGIAVDAADLDAVYEALVALLRDPDLAARMGAAGRARVEQEFSMAAVTAAVRARLAELAATHQRSASS